QLVYFKEIFWDSFHRPNLKSEKFTSLWESLEHINHHLAGPFYSIYSKGNCSYLFSTKTKEGSFVTPDDFLYTCIELVKKYKLKIEEVSGDTEDELADKKVLLYQTDIKMELADLAYQIEMENQKVQ